LKSTLKPKKHILPLIVLAQFCCTSLWFAGNAIAEDLVSTFNLSQQAIGSLTSAIQMGFIFGTLIYTLLTIADRFSPSKVFFVSALLGALFNLGILFKSNTLPSTISFRFFTGFFLAGIYPVGMKIASDYFEKGLGKSLSFLVGALVLGTAFPHILKSYPNLVDWKTVIYTTSGMTVFGGLLIFRFVPDGPFQKLSSKLDIEKSFKVFRNIEFKKAAFGYFGHMWELYAFWAFVPLLLSSYNTWHNLDVNVSLWTFIIIAIGALGCVFAGLISEKIGAKKTAKLSLGISGLCCLISPLLLYQDSIFILLVFLLVWGLSVIADSPLLSTLITQSVRAESKGTALTISTCIGFSITIMSIELLSYLFEYYNSIWIFMLLGLGPIFGLFALSKKA
jgi:MFS family permease